MYKVERPGSLLGFQSLRRPPEAMPFGARADQRSICYSVDRTVLLEVVSVHDPDGMLNSCLLKSARDTIKDCRTLGGFMDGASGDGTSGNGGSPMRGGGGKGTAFNTSPQQQGDGDGEPRKLLETLPGLAANPQEAEPQQGDDAYRTVLAYKLFDERSMDKTRRNSDTTTTSFKPGASSKAKQEDGSSSSSSVKFDIDVADDTNGEPQVTMMEKVDKLAVAVESLQAQMALLLERLPGTPPNSEEKQQQQSSSRGWLHRHSVA